jgi:DNA-binding transcriptional LysR family regulator
MPGGRACRIQAAVDQLLRDRDAERIAHCLGLLHRVGSIRMVIAGSPGYLARRGVPQEPADLAGHDCVVFADVPGAAVWRFRTPAGRQAIEVPARLRANSLDAVVAAALGGAGLVRAPPWHTADHVAGRRAAPRARSL